MRKLIPGTIGIYISDTNELTYWDNSPVDLKKSEDGRVEITLSGRHKLLDLDFLRLLAFFEIPPAIDVDNVRFYRIAIQKKQIPYRARFVAPVYYGKPTATEALRIVASYPTTAVTIDGKVYNMRAGRWVPSYTNKSGYVRVTIWNPLSLAWADIGVHQLVALAWVNKNQDMTHIVVDHIDGNKLNNHASNLRWVTIEENNLYKDIRLEAQKPLVHKVRDVTDGKIYKFKSITKLCDFIGVKSHQASTFKSNCRNRLFNDRYEVRVEGDIRPWYFVDENLVTHTAARYSILVIEPGEHRHLFNGSKEFREYYGIRGHMGIEEMVQKFKEKFPLYEIKYTNLSDFRPVEVMDVDTQEVTEYRNRREAADNNDIDYQLMTQAILTEGRKVIKGKRYRYKVKTPWPEVKRYERKGKVIIEEKSTGKTLVYDSLIQASQYIHLHRRTLSRMLYEPDAKDLYKVYYEDPIVLLQRSEKSSHELLESHKDDSTTK